MKIDLSRVVGSFECPECKIKTQVSFTEVLEVGSPICASCDEEMELRSEEGELLEPVEPLESPQDDSKENNETEEALEEIYDPEGFVPLSFFAVIGTKVRFHKRPVFIDADLPSYFEEARKQEDKYLKDNEIYTVSHIDIRNAFNNVYLVEIAGIYFDIARFEEF